MSISILTAEGLAKLLQKVKTVFATKTEVASTINDLTSPNGEAGRALVHKTGNETIAGTKAFSSTINGSISGNAATATKIQRAPAGTTYVAAATAGNALVNAITTGYGAVWNAPTKNYRVAMSTYPSSNDQILWYSVTNANISSGSNTVAKSMNWDASTGTLTATAFS
jgi:hypothetical protein